MAAAPARMASCIWSMPGTNPGIALQIGDEMFVGTFRSDRIAYFSLK
jgi:hypothetical protein